MLSPERASRLAALVDRRSPLSRLSRAQGVCALCEETTGATGVALCVAEDGLHPLTSTVCGTDEVSLRLEELQLGLAEGPIADALDSTFPVLVPDLNDVSHPRWLWFSPAAAETGVGALFVLPLCVGETRLGALSLYRSTCGDLTAGEFDDFAALAEAATEILLVGSARGGEVSGSWAVGAGTGFLPEIHQAVGMIMGHLFVGAEHALARLRGHAFAGDQSISEVAHQIVQQRLRLEPDAA